MDTRKIDTIKTLGTVVRTARKKSNLSQAEIAGLCKVGVRFISDLENGKPTIEFERALRVVKGLGLELVIKQKSWE